VTTSAGKEHEITTGMSNNYKTGELEDVSIAAPKGKCIVSFKTTLADKTRHGTPVLGSIEIDQLSDL
jgi:hypothetical protein